MPLHVLCNEPALAPCAPKMRLRASGWIDQANFGETGIPTVPPAGVRLRWTTPFLTPLAADRLGHPASYLVQRAGPLQAADLLEFAPDVGHASRAPTHRRLWRGLDRTDPLRFACGVDACSSVEAVAFELPADALPTLVTLIDVNGIAQVSAHVRPGETFHFELSGVHEVHFSAPGVREVRALDLGLAEVDLPFQEIARIDPNCWTASGIADLGERIANAAGEPFRSIREGDWDSLHDRGREVERLLAAGEDDRNGVIAGLRLMAETSFEVAALIGCGFVDGEHPAAPRLDAIRLQDMLGAADGRVYAYRVQVALQADGGAVSNLRSTICFAQASPMSALSDPHCAAVAAPIARSEVVNARPTTAPLNPVRPGGTTEDRVVCKGAWRLSSRLPFDEVVATRPVASASGITGEPFEDRGTFLSGANLPPRTVVGNDLVEIRELRFDIPFFDSDVGLVSEVRDFWDRRKAGGRPVMVRPQVDYSGSALPLAGAACRPPRGGSPAGADLSLDTTLAWRADRLAAASDAKLVLMMRDPARSPAEADVEVGPASPADDGHWMAILRSGMTQMELSRYVGGTLSVGALSARVRSIGVLSNGEAELSFEAMSECAGAELYACSGPFVAARLSEDPQSERLWLPLDPSISILRDRSVAKLAQAVRLPDLSASQTLYFATRVEFEFEGRTYKSAITVPVAAPYIHPAPSPPEVCLAIEQIATDFYGRAVIRAEATCCERLDARYAVELTVAIGKHEDPDEFAKVALQGILGPQQPFGELVFEAFDALARRRDGSDYTLGTAYLREADGRGSAPHLDRLLYRKVE